MGFDPWWGQVAESKAIAGPPRDTPGRVVLSEKNFMAAVISIAKARGWRVYHTHDSRRSEPGFPDLVMLRDGIQVVAELKVGSNATTPEQDEWLAEYRKCDGVEVFEWRPGNWSEIMEVLK